MGLSKLSEACKKCPYVDTCNHKRMEAVGYLPTPKLNTLNSQITEIKVNDVPLNSLTDMLKPIYNALRYFKGKRLISGRLSVHARI